MAQCFDAQLNRYVYCSTGYGAYIAVGIVLPLAIFVFAIIVSAYIRFRRRRTQRNQQQISMTTVVPINNTDGEQQPVPYNYSYPPNYASVIDSSFDKPPSYEQTVQYLSETNNRSEDPAVILPVSTITRSASTQAAQSSRREH